MASSNEYDYYEQVHELEHQKQENIDSRKSNLPEFVQEDEDHSKCGTSSGIHDCLTFGQGELDSHGFWERPCHFCARKSEKDNPEFGACWPHTQEQLKIMKMGS